MSLPRPLQASFSDQRLTDAGLRARLRAGAISAEVGDLQLDGNRLTAAGVEAVGAVAFVNLVALDLAGNRLGDAGAQALSAQTGFRHVRTLSLARNRLTALGLTALLAEGSAVASLWGLDLSGNPLGDAGALALAGSPRASMLQVLNLEKIGLTDAGAMALATSGVLSRLRTLYVGGNALTTAGREALRASKTLPECRIDFGE